MSPSTQCQAFVLRTERAGECWTKTSGRPANAGSAARRSIELEDLGRDDSRGAGDRLVERGDRSASAWPPPTSSILPGLSALVRANAASGPASAQRQAITAEV